MGNVAAAEKKKESEFKQQQPVQESLQQKKRNLSNLITGLSYRMYGEPPEKREALKKQKEDAERELNSILKNQVMTSTPKPMQAQKPAEKAPAVKSIEVEARGTVVASMKNGSATYQHGDIPNLFLNQVTVPKYA
ncbi:MAG: hypothetical protein WC759_04140 [Candidatus Micrarchaeia archaeon]|jgi:hypothetical protein